MKSYRFLFLAVCALLSFSSCSEENSNDPEPEVKKTFTGCRLVRISSIATWDTTVRGHTEYIYDANNRIIESKEFYRGQYNASRFYFYDAQGRLIRSEPYGYYYEYNAAGNLVKVGQPNHISQVYHYNSGGLVDSSWSDYWADGIFKPSFLCTYTYDSKNRLKTISRFEISATGIINPIPIDSGSVGIYDNYKNPYALPSFTIGKIDPFLTPNNLLDTGSQLFTYVYRPDSLVSEVTSVSKPNSGTSGGGITKFIYDCN